MLLTAGSVVLGVGIGLAIPPSSTRFARPRVRVPALLVAGVVGQVVAARMDGRAAVWVGVVALLALIVFAVTNLHLTGMGVLTIGLCANAAVMALNGGMPVRAKSLVAADVVSRDEVAAIELRGPRHLERSSDRLTALGDIIPLNGQVVSYGDLIIAVATVDVIAHIARRQRRQAFISTVKPDHDWGMAPRPVPSSASQYSANPDANAPRTLVSATAAPATHNK